MFFDNLENQLHLLEHILFVVVIFFVEYRDSFDRALTSIF